MSVTTLFPLNVSNVSGVTNSVAFFVITTKTRARFSERTHDVTRLIRGYSAGDANYRVFSGKIQSVLVFRDHGTFVKFFRRVRNGVLAGGLEHVEFLVEKETCALCRNDYERILAADFVHKFINGGIDHHKVYILLIKRISVFGVEVVDNYRLVARYPAFFRFDYRKRLSDCRFEIVVEHDIIELFVFRKFAFCGTRGDGEYSLPSPCRDREAAFREPRTTAE